jgi:hypothetical protein
LKDYHGAAPFIAQIRSLEGKPALYCEFEWLAERWGAKADHPPPHRWWAFWR